MEREEGELLIAEPLGMCAGVRRAIETVEQALDTFNAPVYVRHEIVHNTHIIESLRNQGAIFVEDIAEVPTGAVLVLNAHGVSAQVREEAQSGGRRVFDATCPFVAKIHVEIAKLSREGFDFLLIGHAGHPEVEGTLGQLPGRIHLVTDVADVLAVAVPDPNRLAVATQTTMSVDDARDILAAIRHRFPQAREPRLSDICYATTNRQEAVRQLAPEVDLVLVVGSATSSNARRLYELAQRRSATAYLVDGPDDLEPAWFAGRPRVGLSAGASVPDSIVQRVVDRVRALGIRSVSRVPGAVETIVFPPVPGLRRVSSLASFTQGNQL
jgi:4-hydroxy-3-methylbut-2-enyl diphosphate reductase